MKQAELKFRFSIFDTLMALEVGQEIEIPRAYAKVASIKVTAFNINGDKEHNREIKVSEAGRTDTTLVWRVA